LWHVREHTFDNLVALKRAVGCVWLDHIWSLTAESVQGTSLSLQSVHDIHGGDSLPLGMLGVGDGITDDILKEYLEDSTGLLVDQSGDTLDTASASQTADCGLGDSLDVITQDFSVTLGASLSQSFASFSSSRHDDDDEFSS
jgi:hypothetical protein